MISSYTFRFSSFSDSFAFTFFTCAVKSSAGSLSSDKVVLDAKPNSILSLISVIYLRRFTGQKTWLRAFSPFLWRKAQRKAVHKAACTVVRSSLQRLINAAVDALSIFQRTV